MSRLGSNTLRSLLKDWYGKEDAEAEMLPHLPRTKSLSEALKYVVSRKIPAGKLKIADIQSEWKKIAGAENARRAYPSHLADGVLYIEVMHPGYLQALNVSAVKNPILEKAQALAGTDYCRELKFIPCGGRRMSGNEN